MLSYSSTMSLRWSLATVISVNTLSSSRDNDSCTLFYFCNTIYMCIYILLLLKLLPLLLLLLLPLSHLPLTSWTSSTAMFRLPLPLTGPLALNMTRNCLSRFLNIILAFSQVFVSEESWNTDTVPGETALYGQERMVRGRTMPSGITKIWGFVLASLFHPK